MFPKGWTIIFFYRGGGGGGIIIFGTYRQFFSKE